MGMPFQELRYTKWGPWFDKINVKELPWPAQSPDLNLTGMSIVSQAFLSFSKSTLYTYYCMQKNQTFLMANTYIL